MAKTVKNNLLTYDLGDSDFGSDFEILDAGHGDCTDFAALYVSLARSLDIPSRGVRIFFKYRPDGPGGKEEKNGHAFAEGRRSPRIQVPSRHR